MVLRREGESITSQEPLATNKTFPQLKLAFWCKQLFATPTPTYKAKNMSKNMAPELPNLPCLKAFGVIFCPDVCSYFRLVCRGRGSLAYLWLNGSIKNKLFSKFSLYVMLKIWWSSHVLGQAEETRKEPTSRSPSKDRHAVGECQGAVPAELRGWRTQTLENKAYSVPIGVPWGC